jgi:hypothetical protein
MSFYNGWTNYATWRVKLEMFDGLNPNEMGWDIMDASYLSVTLKDYAEDYITETSIEGLARDYALAFLSDVDWCEIAAHMIADYCEEEGEEE